ncbi:MAG: hypothetical protein FJZ64_04975, partial [Chlamydiae bacterium]|nr:hypothetical protein [Chlamydiota bacterium]
MSNPGSISPVRAPLLDDGAPPYIFCNEQGQERTIQELARQHLGGNSHIGFSGWLNYDIMAVTNPQRAIICDINPRMIEFYRVFQETLLDSLNRSEFIRNLKEKLDSRRAYFDNGCLEQLASEQNRVEGWLSSDERFNFIKKMHEEGRIRYEKLDATDRERFQKVTDSYRPIQTVYASNIYEWLENAGSQERADFQANCRGVMDLETRYIDAFYPLMNSRTRQPIATGSGPPLRTTQGELPPFTRKPADRPSRGSHGNEE